MKKICLLLLHNRSNSGLYSYANIYNSALPASDIVLLSDLYRGISQWELKLNFKKYKHRIEDKLIELTGFYDLIHIIDNPAYAFEILKMLNSRHLPVIYTLHDPEGHIGLSFKERLKTKIELFLQYRVNRFIEQSNNIRLHIHYNYTPITSVMSEVIISPHPIYTAHQLKHRSQIYPPIVLSYLGRIEYYKGIDIFLDILGKLDQVVKPGEVKAIIAGVGHIPAHSRLTNVELDINNQYVSDEKLDSILNETHIMLLPYRRTSQSGILMKAITSDVPVMVSDIEELTSYIETGSTGFAFRLDDIGAWVEKILYFMRNYAELEIIRKNIFNFKKRYKPLAIAEILYQNVDDQLKML